MIDFKEGIKFLLTGFFIILVIYHFFVWLGRRKDLSNLAYSLYSLCVGTLMFNGQIYPYLKNFNIKICLMIVILTSTATPIVLVFFLTTIYNLKKIKIPIYIFYFINCSLFLITEFIYLLSYNRLFISIFLGIIIIISIIYTILITSVIFITRQYMTLKNILVLIGTLVSVVISLVLCYFTIIAKENLNFIYTFSPYLVMLLLYAIALVTGFNQEHKELKELNLNLEKIVKERTDKLEKVHNEKINFFINLAHEIKTPLTLIKNYVDIHIGDIGESDAMQVVRFNVNKLLYDMLNFLDLEKLNKGQMQYNHDQIIDLSEMIKEKSAMFKSSALKKNINFTCSNIEQRLYTKINAFAIERILNNILDNALKYTNENGNVEITLTSTKNKIILLVSDTGIGIAKEQMKYIFEMYHQINNEKSNYQGIGMGLSLVKKIIDEINGEIYVESELGEGTKFKLVFNRHKLKKGEKIYKNQNTDELSSSLIPVKTKLKIKSKKHNIDKKTILLVEDSIDMLAHLQNNFIEEYNVYSAINGLSALEALENIEQIPDLIISDIMMDGMNGYDLYDKLSENEIYKAIPFIFLSAKSGEEEKILGLSKGAIDFISKPFNIKELKQKVKSMINIVSKNREQIEEKIIEDMMEFANSRKIQTVENIYKKYKITDKQREIIKLIVQGYQNKEISSMLGLSYDSVRTIISRLFKKCKVDSRTKLAMLFKTDK